MEGTKCKVWWDNLENISPRGIFWPTIGHYKLLNIILAHLFSKTHSISSQRQIWMTSQRQKIYPEQVMWEKSHGTHFIQSEKSKSILVIQVVLILLSEKITRNNIVKEKIMFCQKPHGFFLWLWLLLGIHLIWKKKAQKELPLQ